MPFSKWLLIISLPNTAGASVDFLTLVCQSEGVIWSVKPHAHFAGYHNHGFFLGLALPTVIYHWSYWSSPIWHCAWDRSSSLEPGVSVPYCFIFFSALSSISSWLLAFPLAFLILRTLLFLFLKLLSSRSLHSREAITCCWLLLSHLILS